MLIFFVAWKLVHRASFVDIRMVDLRKDEHLERSEDHEDTAQRQKRMGGKQRWLWKAYYLIA